MFFLTYFFDSLPDNKYNFILTHLIHCSGATGVDGTPEN